MRTVFLVGNGFDMAAGLDTKPATFINYFLAKAERLPEEDPAHTLAKSIQIDGVNAWSNYELMLGQHAVDFAKEDEGAFLEQVDALTEQLGFWLEEKEKLISNDFVEQNAKKCLTSMATFPSYLPVLRREMIQNLRNSRSNEDWHFDLICFNYTDLLFRMYQKMDGEGSILHNLNSGRKCLLGRYYQVHGNLRDQRIICGVDNSTQIANTAFAESEMVNRTLVKSAAISEVVGDNTDKLALKAINRADIICIFGMSFGLTDARWWKQVRKRLSENSSSLLVLFSYDLASNLSPYRMHQQDLVVRGVMDQFFNSCGDEKHPTELTDRIIVAQSSLVFPFASMLVEQG